MPDPVALVPIRSFGGMTRLSDALGPDQRSQLSRTLASRLLASVTAAGLRSIVITPSHEVAAWAREHGADSCADPGQGLSDAAQAGVSIVGDDPWIVVHADLPLVTPHAIATVANACDATPVLVPSHDGGTAVIACRGHFEFSYGIGSFRRHFAAVPDATVVVLPELSIDIDTPRQLEPFAKLLGVHTT